MANFTETVDKIIADGKAAGKTWDEIEHLIEDEKERRGQEMAAEVKARRDGPQK